MQRPTSRLHEPRVQALDSLRIVGLQHHYSPATAREIPQLWQRLAAYRGRISVQVGQSFYGVSFNAGQSGFDYIAGVEVSGFCGLPQELSQLELAARQYYVFDHSGHVSEIPSTVAAILNEWAPASRYAFCALPSMIERYGEGFDPQTGAGDIQILMPAKS